MNAAFNARLRESWELARNGHLLSRRGDDAVTGVPSPTRPGSFSARFVPEILPSKMIYISFSIYLIVTCL